MGSAVPLIAIYLYTKFDLNVTIGFKLFAGQGTGWTDKVATICFHLWGAHKSSLLQNLGVHDIEKWRILLLGT